MSEEKKIDENVTPQRQEAAEGDKSLSEVEFNLQDLGVLHKALSSLDIKGADWKIVGKTMSVLEAKIQALKEAKEKAG